MRKLLPILQIIEVLLLLSLYFHNDMLLIVAAVVIAVCVVLTFSNMKKQTITSSLLYSFPAGSGAGTPQQEHFKTRERCRSAVPEGHNIFKN